MWISLLPAFSGIPRNLESNYQISRNWKVNHPVLKRNRSFISCNWYQIQRRPTPTSRDWKIESFLSTHLLSPVEPVSPSEFRALDTWGCVLLEYLDWLVQRKEMEKCQVFVFWYLDDSKRLTKWCTMHSAFMGSKVGGSGYPICF